MVRLSEAYREAHDIKWENENPTKFGKDKVSKNFVKPAAGSCTDIYEQNAQLLLRWMSRSTGQMVNNEMNIKHYVCILVEWSNLTIEFIIIHDLKY